jgi:sulfur-oxidizing protein SoxY
MIIRHSRRPSTRRRWLQGAVALACVPWLPARAAELPDIPAMATFLAGRAPRTERVRLTLPPLADNGNAVPMKVIVDGPFGTGPHVTSIRLYSEVNPVPEMAEFDFPVALEGSKWNRGAPASSTQHVIAIATLSDGALLSAVAEVVVTLAGCMDGT